MERSRDRDVRLGIMCCQSPKLWELFTFIKGKKKKKKKTPGSFLFQQLHACLLKYAVNFLDVRKIFTKLSTACSGTANVSPRGQLNKWQKPHSPCCFKQESHQTSQFRGLQQKPPGRKSSCANLFPSCFLCCKVFIFFPETIHLLNVVETDFVVS